MGVNSSNGIGDDRSQPAITTWSERPWGTPWAGRDDVVAEAATFQEVTVWVQGMMPPSHVTLRHDGSASGGDVLASLDTGDFETLALAVAFLVATAPPPGPGPEERVAAAVAALPESDRRVFELDRQHDDGTRATAAEIAAETDMSERAVEDAIQRINKALMRANPHPPTDIGSSGLHVVRSSGEDISVASTWDAPSPVVYFVQRLVEPISKGLEWRPASPDGRGGEILWGSGLSPIWIARPWIPPPPEQLPFEVVCPKTSDGHLVARRHGQTGHVFWGCSAYPRCDFTTDDPPTGAVHDVTRAVQEETIAAHAEGRGAVARRGESGICLTCGAVVELPQGNLVGLRLPGWACPEHGNADVVILTSREGRVYGACELCDDFDDGLTPEQRATKQAEVDRKWEERRQGEERRQREEREEAEGRQAQLLADQRAPTCAHCGQIERLHADAAHPFAGGILDHATTRLIQAALVLGVIVAFWLFWVSATTPDAPFHSFTGPLLCFWDWKGTACP